MPQIPHTRNDNNFAGLPTRGEAGPLGPAGGGSMLKLLVDLLTGELTTDQEDVELGPSLEKATANRPTFDVGEEVKTTHPITAELQQARRSLRGK